MNKPKILILEDDEISCQVYIALFSKSEEYDLVICRNVREYYSQIDNHDVDLFIIDIGLGYGKNGNDIIKELRQSEKYSKSPIIVVTAYVSIKDEINSISAGATVFIRKPFENKKIREIVSRLTLFKKEKTNIPTN